ncbi:MAG: NAD(P)-dependent oxidoreductase [Burkholderiales bacterium]|nr:NAD(P)-dependent oxidoreductase [Burkholderiales bacterium]
MAAAIGTPTTVTAALPVVGWIGLGNIGAPMAHRVLAAGFSLRVWARRPEAVGDIARAGADVAATPEALARSCDIVATIVGGPDDVVGLQQRMIGEAKRGSVFVDLTTAAPGTAAAGAALASAAGVGLLDAPVTGGVAGAAKGSLTCFVGGDAAALETVRPLLATFCARIVPCGPAGAGYRMKLVNQTIVAGTLLGVAHGAALARSWDLTAPLVRDALGSGTASGFLFDAYLERMLPPAGAATFTLGMLRKDLRLARAEARTGHGDAAFLDTALAAVDTACTRHGEHAGVQWLAATN